MQRPLLVMLIVSSFSTPAFASCGILDITCLQRERKAATQREAEATLQREKEAATQREAEATLQREKEAAIQREREAERQNQEDQRRLAEIEEAKRRAKEQKDREKTILLESGTKIIDSLLKVLFK